jgi:hypothetical protein
MADPERAGPAEIHSNQARAVRVEPDRVEPDRAYLDRGKLASA